MGLALKRSKQVKPISRCIEGVLELTAAFCNFFQLCLRYLGVQPTDFSGVAQLPVPSPGGSVLKLVASYSV